MPFAMMGVFALALLCPTCLYKKSNVIVNDFFLLSMGVDTLHALGQQCCHFLQLI
jgi:hypothetical protein